MKMRKVKTSCALGVLTLLAGAQSSFALKCEGKVFFQPQKSWTEAYVYSAGMFTKLESTDGWYSFDAAKVGAENETAFVFSGNGKWEPGMWFNRTKTNDTEMQMLDDLQNTMFSCSDFNGKDALYIYPDPTNVAKSVVSTDAPNAKRLHVLLPTDDALWFAGRPLISFDGTYKNAKPLSADLDNCGWFTYTWFNQKVNDSALLIRNDDTNVEFPVGMNGLNANVVAPIALSDLFELFETNDLYYVVDEELWDNLDLRPNNGFADKINGDLCGVCRYNLTTLIYDTDASLHPAFSCWSPDGEGCQNGAQGVSREVALKALDSCHGVTSGLVEETLGDDNKPVLSKTGEKCFINKGLFNQLFNYTKNVNEVSCFDMPFNRSVNGNWEFDSDYYTSPGTKVKGGFFPVERSTDASVLASKSNQTPLPAARTKYTAEGPVFFGPELREYDEKENARVIDLACNGPAWRGGHDCEGLFADGDSVNAFFEKYYKKEGENLCVFGWSCPYQSPAGWTFYKEGSETVSENGTFRWTSAENAEGTGGRNQLFCSESHASFVYMPGLRFSVLGDDDIWVYVDKKLAVDLGGTHLAAPGYIDLDSFKGKSGELKVGNTYDMDIFFCDRRTTMSDIRISTNMYLQQSSASNLKVQRASAKDAESKYAYQVCYKKGESPCESRALGNSQNSEICDSELEIYDIKINYYILDSSKKKVVSAEKLAKKEVYCGGIDLTNRATPVIDQKNVQGCDLKPGAYTLVAEIGNESTSYSMHFRVAGEDMASLPEQVRVPLAKLSITGRMMEMSLENARTDYSVMDIQGRVVAKGVLQSRAMVIVPTAGTYLVKMGSEVRKVTIR